MIRYRNAIITNAENNAIKSQSVENYKKVDENDDEEDTDSSASSYVQQSAIVETHGALRGGGSSELNCSGRPVPKCHYIVQKL